jgi:hypothetical protein
MMRLLAVYSWEGRVGEEASFADGLPIKKKPIRGQGQAGARSATLGFREAPYRRYKSRIYSRLKHVKWFEACSR